MLSIIIITKQEEDYLPRLLKSIKSQTFRDYEIIVADANSTDNTRKIARSFGCKIVDGGLPSVGRNKGASKSRGEFLLFLDADVFFDRDFIEKNIKEFKKRKLVCATPIYIPASEYKFDKFIYKSYNFFAFLMQFFSPHAGGMCIFIKKNIFNKLNGFNEKIIMAEDHDFVNRSCKYGKFRILKSVPIMCDIRRLDKDGRLNIIKNYMLAEAYRFVNGEIKKSLFKYELQGGVKLSSIIIKI